MAEKEKQKLVPEKKPIWTRYGLWLLIPILFALYYGQDTIVLAGKESRQVLPTTVVPNHYDIQISPDISNFVFNGTVNVDLAVKKATSVIVLNGRDIVIDIAKVKIENQSYKAIGVQYNNKTEQISLKFDKSFPKHSKIKLQIIFRGNINDLMKGFYRSSYKDENNNTRYLASTQFEATSARWAFPCWDEPALKATFDITLIVPKKLVALSNMDVKSTVPASWSSDLKVVQYKTTPRMSTYLVAFVIGPFEYIEGYAVGKRSTRSIRTRVYTLPGLKEQGRHALDVAMKAISYYGEVFGIPYPLSKLDMVAIPDFDAGAMENWGLVTYRTTALLYDDKKSSFLAKRQTAYTICHELAHQWFGNLVTMEWWNDLWLNEGFATWVGWYAVDHIFPSWKVWTMFGTQEFQEALYLDSLPSSHPIEVTVNNPSEIHQIFDSISYLKGASVIRMVTSWLSIPIFTKGIQSYLKDHNYGNAATKDLWNSLSEESNKNVGKFMNNWVRKTGYPLLNVTIIDDTHIRVTQTRYSLTDDIEPTDDETLWWVPLRLKHKDGVEEFTLVNKTQIFKIPKDATFKLNYLQTGLYRVQYPPNLLNRLMIEFHQPQFRQPPYLGVLSEPVDRAGLISDVGMLSRSGHQPLLNLIKLLDYVKGETDYFVLSEAARQLNHLVSLFEAHPTVLKKLQQLRREIFSPAALSLGWLKGSDETELDLLTRVISIEQAGLAGEPEVLKAAEGFYRKRKLNQIPSLTGIVFKLVLQQAKTEAEELEIWQDIFNRYYRDEKAPIDQRITAISSIGYTIKFGATIQKNLDLILDTEAIRTQDTYILFKSLGSNTHAQKHLIKYFVKNYKKIENRFRESKGSFRNMMNGMLSELHDFGEIDRFEDFISDKDTSEYSRGLNNALEKAKVNAAQLEREKSVLISWSKKQRM